VELVSEAELAAVKEQVGRPGPKHKYPYHEWFKSGLSFRIEKGVDFNSSTTAMVENIRWYAMRRDILVRFSVDGDGVTVLVGPKK
jgi:hypothetical protein